MKVGLEKLRARRAEVLERAEQHGARSSRVRVGRSWGGGRWIRAKPAIGFPASLPGWFLSEHRWHLACEFSNWITAYATDAGLA